MSLFYCAMLFQRIIFWEDNTVWNLFWYEESVKQVTVLSERLTHVAPKNELEVRTWGASLKECQRIPAKDHLKLLSFRVELDKNEQVCR